MISSSRIALVFPGQGTQFVGMCRDVYEVYPAARDVFDQADDILGFSLSRLCFEGPEDELRQTVNVQPAIVTMSLALLAVITSSSRSLEADFTAGHSLGEYSALSAAGAISTTGAITLARRRGELMQQAGTAKRGAMTAIIGLDEKAIETVCAETGVFIANYNSAGQIVISGEALKIETAGKLAMEKGARKVIPLQVSGAFHTPLMEPAAKGLASAIAKAKWAEPDMPVIANTTNETLHSVASIKKELTDQLTHAIKWQQGVTAMTAFGVDTFIEIGPGKVLTGLIKRISPGAKTVNIGDVNSLHEYIEKGLNL